MIKMLASEVDIVVSVVVNRLQRLHFQKYIKFIHTFSTLPFCLDAKLKIFLSNFFLPSKTNL